MFHVHLNLQVVVGALDDLSNILFNYVVVVLLLVQIEISRNVDNALKLFR